MTTRSIVPLRRMSSAQRVPVILLVSARCLPYSATWRGGLPLQYRGLSGDPDPRPSPNPNALPDPPEGDDATQQSFRAKWGPTLFKMFESAATTFASIAILGLVGYSYTRYYKHMVLQKIDNAFKPGDPYLELAGVGEDESSSAVHWVTRAEQDQIDAIISGQDQGHYFLLIGEKGTGKSSMIIEAMKKVGGDGISMFDAHGDLEIFRIRLGRALDFEFHEDNIGSLFSIRGPRDASALLDVERALNKFEKVALKRRNEGGRPLIIIINAMHLIRDDDDGQDLLELIQQRAEMWCATNLATVVLNSDDYWVYERLKQHATRMELLPVLDLTKDKAMTALANYRQRLTGQRPPHNILEEIYDRVGGRLAFLTRVAKADDMLATCDEICEKEKTWFLNQCWILGEEMDDDVMDQQKYASAAMVLAKALVEKEKDMELTYDPSRGYILPEIPLHEARYIMTRADFIKSYDQINVFTINSKAMVRADSVPMQRAFREICSQEGFDKHLEATLDRISAIESLGRTRELTIKDLWNKGRYSISMNSAAGQPLRNITFEVAARPEDTEDD
ncbi:hypothetical protein FH972_026214 [Carpinus fangiana]|uniref:Uncharacterized protein n=1 Tax=Carpinus fangiana TaxID=176857 RepID=A0A5N6L3H2_9ROSI|nr:hypothetical protein FH972_026214 [Carpinus fangiana]